MCFFPSIRKNLICGDGKMITAISFEEEPYGSYVLRNCFQKMEGKDGKL